MDIYVVQQGDNVDAIAAKYQISVDVLTFDNQIEYPYRLAVGQALFIDDGQEAPDRRPLYVSGYAYPFITTEVLRETLPWVNGIYVFSYGFTAEGELIPPQTSDTDMVTLIRGGGVMPVITLTPLDAEGRFNNQFITGLLGNTAVQEQLIRRLKEEMQRKGFGGVDIDFEYVLAEDRDAFSALVRRMSRSMNASGYVVSVALAPKTSRDQRGTLYEGVDYAGLGMAANRTMLMTYEWGYTYGYIRPGIDRGRIGYTVRRKFAGRLSSFLLRSVFR